MVTSKRKKEILLLSAFLIMPVMLIVFRCTITLLGVKKGYFVGIAIYWLYCITITLVLLKKQKTKFKKTLCFRLSGRREVHYFLIAMIPVLPVFFIKFLPNVHSLSICLLIFVLMNSVINGVIEELYWRGLFLIEFSDNSLIGVWLSSILFTVWHTALYSISEISYGGFLPLVVGSAIMGCIWAFCSRKLRGISFTIMAHVLVNIFAFAGFFVDNGFM